MKRVPLWVLPLVLAGAQPQRPQVDGTYQMLICRNGCGAAGTDTSRASGFTVQGQILSGVDRSPIGQLSYADLAAEGFRQYRLTDSTGRFRFFFVPAGKYELKFGAFAYDPRRDSIRVERDTTLTVVMPAHCKHDSAAALRDIALDRVVVILHSMTLMTRVEAMAQRRYDFEYLERGDMVYEPGECEAQYNRVIFRYFDRRYGTGWRDSVRVR